MLIETEKIITKKLINPNKLPFLQFQILKVFMHQPTSSLDQFVSKLQEKIELKLGLYMK